MMDWEIENAFFLDGCKTVCGVDEAGRGPLAGPVYAAAVILPRGIVIDGLNDSKKLSEKKREKLYAEICEKADCYAIGFAGSDEIDEINILNAVYLAMNIAIEKLSIKPNIALIDGNRSEGITGRTHCVIGGDGKSASIAAASILAKVSRDRYMRQVSEKYPEYLFHKHKGYGTRLHFELIEKYGLSDIHRKTFLIKHKKRMDEAT